nr:MAG TPA: hypothetical protein [Caudoviricetes sp.]
MLILLMRKNPQSNKTPARHTIFQLKGGST